MKVYRHELVEIPVDINATGQKTFSIPDLPNIRNVALLGVQFHYDGTLLFAPSGRAVLGQDFLARSIITLQGYNGVQFIYKMPLLNLHNLLSSAPTNVFQLQFVGQRINFPKSQIDSNLNGFTMRVESSIVFSVFYRNLGEEKSIETGTFRKRS